MKSSRNYIKVTTTKLNWKQKENKRRKCIQNNAHGIFCTANMKWIKFLLILRVFQCIRVAKQVRFWILTNFERKEFLWFSQYSHSSYFSIKNSKDCFQWNMIATIKILVCSQSKIHFSWNWNSHFSNLLLDKCFRMRKFDFNWNSLNKYSTWTLIFNIQMTSCIFIWESFASYRKIHF